MGGGSWNKVEQGNAPEDGGRGRGEGGVLGWRRGRQEASQEGGELLSAPWVSGPPGLQHVYHFPVEEASQKNRPGVTRSLGKTLREEEWWW